MLAAAFALAGCTPQADVQQLNQNQFTQGSFDIQGIVPIGYAVFAVALGIAAGALIGRSLPALAVTAIVR